MALVQKTVYLREEDLEAWNNIPNKAKWLHEGLTRGIVMIPARSLDLEEKIARAADNLELVDKTLNTKQKAEFLGASYVAGDKAHKSKIVTLATVNGAVKAVREVEPCRHGADPKYCKFAKNGKVCK